MVYLTSILVSTYDLNALTISWEVVPTVESLTDYELDVYRAETPGPIDDYTIITSGLDLSAGTSYTDISVSGLQSYRFRDFYYRLKVRNTVNLSEFVSEPSKFQGTPDNAAKEIIRRHAITLSADYGGERIMVYKRKTFGTICPDCYDPILQRVTEECTTCFNTQYEGGYYTGVETTGMMNAAVKANQLREWGNWEPTDGR